MDALPLWVDGAIQVVGWTLLHFVWQGALIGLAYGLLRTQIRSSRGRYAVGVAALGLLALAPLLTALRVALAEAPATLSNALPQDLGRSVVTAAGATPAFSLTALLPWLVVAWALGVLLLTVRALVHWRQIGALLRDANLLPEWDERLAALCRRFGVRRPIRLLWTDRISTPTLIGWLRPVILLPAAVALGFPAAQVELILAHELGHIRRWDYLVNLIQVVIETVLFYHPVVHWVSRDLRNEREICCDELVLQLTRGNPRVYAQTLADLEGLRVEETARLALAASGGVLLERVQRIAGVQVSVLATRPSGRLMPLVIAGIVAAIGLARHQLGVRDADLAALLASPTSLFTTIYPAAPRVRVADLAVARPALARLEAGDEAQESLSLPSIAVTGTSFPAQAQRVGNLSFAPPAEPPLLAPLAAAAAPSEPVPVKMLQPVYPQEALERSIEGEVVLEFSLTRKGEVRSVRVAAADPPRVFDAAAMQALRWWKYDPASIGDLGARYRRTFVFSLGGSHLALSQPVEEVAAEQECRTITGSRICRHSDGSGSSTEVQAADAVQIH